MMRSLRHALPLLVALTTATTARAQSFDWVSADEGLNAADATTLTINASGDPLLGTRDGLYLYDRGAGSWIRVLPDLPIDVVTPADGDVHFAKSTFGSYRTTDRGRTWAPMAVASTGLFDRSGDGCWFTTLSTPAQNVMRSTDKGWHWDRFADPAKSFVAYDCDSVIIGGPRPVLRHSDGSIVGRSSDSLFRSTDNGATWTLVGPWLVDNLSEMPGGDLVGTTGEGIQRSSDDGRTWSAIEGSPRARLLAVVPDGEMWAAVGTRIYRRRAGSSAWELESRGLDAMRFARVMSDTAGRLLAVGILGDATMNELYLSSDDGRSWIALADSVVDLLGVRGRTIIAARHNDGTSTSRRLSVSNDLGATWRQIGRPGPSPVVRFHGDTVLLLCRNLGESSADSTMLLRSTDNGVTWSKLDSLTRIDDVAHLTGDRLLAVNQWPYRWRRVVTVGIDGAAPVVVGDTLDSASIVVAPDGAKWIATRRGDATTLLRSTDAGLTWSTILQPSTLPFGRLMFAPSGPMYYVASDLRRSTDGGASWLPLPPRPQTSVVVGTRGELYTFGARTAEGSVHRSTDSGASWSVIDNGFGTVEQMVVLPDGRLLVATLNHGLFIGTPKVSAVEAEAGSSRRPRRPRLQ